MSKYQLLWDYFKKKKDDQITLTFLEIEEILGFPINHSFLNSKKELEQYGYLVKKINLKEKKILFERI